MIETVSAAPWVQCTHEGGMVCIVYWSEKLNCQLLKSVIEKVTYRPQEVSLSQRWHLGGLPRFTQAYLLIFYHKTMNNGNLLMSKVFYMLLYVFGVRILL